MFVLCIYVLIADYKRTLHQISTALPSTKVDALTWICDYLQLTDESSRRDLKKKILLKGVGYSAVYWWEEILRLLAQDVVYPKVASELRKKIDHVMTSNVVSEQVFRNTANKLGEINEFHNIELESVIKAKIGEVVRACSRMIERELNTGGKYSLARKKQRGEVNNALTSGFDSSLENDKTKPDIQSLINVQGDRFRRALHNIYSVSSLLFYETTDKSVKQYTLFGAYIKYILMQRINVINEVIPSGLSVMVDNTSRSDGVVIQDKADALVAYLFPYLSSPMSMSTAHEMAEKLYSFMADYELAKNPNGTANTRVSLKVRLDVLLDSEASEWAGNFGRKSTFAKDESSRNFGIYVQALLSLGTLHKWLVEANVNPLTIDPDVFLFEDPSMKFASLEELVRYSKIYCKIRRKYALNKSASLVFEDSALDRNNVNDIFTKIKIEHHDCLSQLQWVRSRDWQEVSVEDSYQKYSQNLGEILDFLECGLNPILYLSSSHCLFEEDEEGNYVPVNLTTELVSSWLEEVNQDLFNEYSYYAYKQYPSVESWAEELEQSGWELAAIIRDLFDDISDDSKVVCILNITNLMDDVMNQITNSVNVDFVHRMSQIELAFACVETRMYPLLKGMKRDDDQSLAEHRFQILKRLMESVEDKQLIDVSISDEVYRNFFTQSYTSNALATLVGKVASALDSIYEMVNASYGYLIDIDHDMEAPVVTDPEVLVKLREGIGGYTQSSDVWDYMDRNNLSQDADGYVRRSNGTYVTRSFKNRIGYLHSSGIFVVSNTRAESAEGCL